MARACARWLAMVSAGLKWVEQACAPLEEDRDGRAQGLELDAKLGQGRDGGRAHDGVLQDDAVVDVADAARRVDGVGPVLAEHVQDAHGELGELAVLDELAQARDRMLARLGDLGHKDHQRVHDRLLVVVPAVLAQVGRQKVQLMQG